MDGSTVIRLLCTDGYHLCALRGSSGIVWAVVWKQLFVVPRAEWRQHSAGVWRPSWAAGRFSAVLFLPRGEDLSVTAVRICGSRSTAASIVSHPPATSVLRSAALGAGK